MTTATPTLTRRQTLKLAGVGLALGTFGTGTASAREGRYIVGTASKAAAREARERASSVSRVLDFGSIGTAVAGRYPEEAIRGLSQRPDVRYVEADGLVHTNAGTADIDSTDGEVPWGVDRVDAEKVHATATGTGAHIAIIDSGIDADHPDLQANLGEGVDFTDVSEYSTRTADWDDDNGHGTHCAGTAGAVADGTGTGVVGVATEATLHAVKVLSASGSGYYSDVSAGIKYVADKGWDVGSMSLGGPLANVIEDACAYAYDRGVLLVAAAGNDGTNVKNTAPAAYNTVVAVSATTDRDARAWFSNFGNEIELAAPGVNVYSTVPGGYGYKSGTSMACPHVAGAAGILMGSGYTNTGARARLQATAEDLGASGRDHDYGYGLLDVEAAAGSSGGGGGSADTTAPSAPTNLAAPSKTETTVDLTWDAATDDTGVDHYTVSVDGSPRVDTTETAATVTGLTAGTAYAFTVTAVDAAGNVSDPSDPLTVTTDESAPVDATPVIDSFGVDSGSPKNPHADVEMNWSVSGAPETVTLELFEGSDTSGTRVGNWTVSATGNRTYSEKHTSPKQFTARLTATNGAGSVDSKKTVTA